VTERGGPQRERGATRAVGLALAPGRLSEEWVEREGSPPGRLSEEWA
jgi:hypothetical protein